jgi:Zn-dependent protease with chaperone function
VNKVPIGRYIVFVGSLLLAMLFVADWLVPMGATQSVTSGKADKPIISIKSDQKWPERIVFDTSAPTIVAQMPPVVAVTPVTNQPREAFALLAAPGAGSFGDPAAG